MKTCWKRIARIAALFAATAFMVYLVAALRRTAHRLESANVLSARECELIDKNGRSVNVQPSGQSPDGLAITTLLGNTRTDACCAQFAGFASRRTMVALQGLPEIQEILLYSINLDNDVMVELARLDSLRKVRIVDCTLSPADLAMVRERLPHCIVDVCTTSRTYVPTPQLELLRQQIILDGARVYEPNRGP